VGVGRSDVYGQHHRPNSLERRLIVVLVDGTVTTSAVSSETTSGGDEPFGEDVSVVLAVRVEDEEDECEGDLGKTGESADVYYGVKKEPLTRQEYHKR
jgi:hypothetical protein